MAGQQDDRSTDEDGLGRQTGAAASEYGLLGSGISVATIPAIKNVGVKLVDIFTTLQGAL